MSRDSDCFTHLFHLGFGGVPGLALPFCEHLIYKAGILLELLVLFTYRGKESIEIFNKGLFKCFITASILCIEWRKLLLTLHQLVDCVDIFGPVSRRVCDGGHDTT